MRKNKKRDLEFCSATYSYFHTSEGVIFRLRPYYCLNDSYLFIIALVNFAKKKGNVKSRCQRLSRIIQT